jgi:hypothetical protein
VIQPRNNSAAAMLETKFSEIERRFERGVRSD